MKKSKPNPKANRNILWFACGIVALFLCMCIYFGYYLQVQSEDVINNPYNARIGRLSDHVRRGRILASDGTVLAETRIMTDSDGTEVRVYPYGELYAHVVGYVDAGKTGVESLANC